MRIRRTKFFFADAVVSALAVFSLLAAQLAVADVSGSSKDLLASGHVDEAISTLQQQVTRSASDAESYNLLCRAHYMLEEWDRGISACEQAQNLDPQNSLYHL